jgi:protein TonB
MKLKKSKGANLERRKSKFFLIGLVFALGVTLSAFEWRSFEVNYTLAECDDCEYTIWDDVEVAIPLPKPVVAAKKIVKKSPIIKIVEEVTIETESKKEEVFADLVEDGLDFGDGEVLAKEIMVVPDIIHLQPEIMPQFNCSNESYDELVKYIQMNVRYPSIDRREGEEGVVYVSFVVGKNGQIRDVKAKNRIGKGCTEEAIRVVKHMPKWCPGKHGEKKVSVEMVLPVKFSLS